MATDEIVLFVGCSANNEDIESQAVLEYTARAHCSRPLEIVWMKQSRDPSNFWSGWCTSMWATPFSGFRWGIPAYMKDKGSQAIYCDSDFIFQADLAELWDQPWQSGKLLMSKGGDEGWRFCCMKWNVEAANMCLPSIYDIKRTPSAHTDLINQLVHNSQLFQRFDGNWNCIDGEDYKSLNHPDIKAIHYSSMPNQVHLKYAIPRLQSQLKAHWFDGAVKPHWRADLQELFDELLVEAIEAGYGPDKYIGPEYGPYKKASQYEMGRSIRPHQWVNS